MALPSTYTPEGAYAYLMATLAATLVAAVVYLLAFTGVTLPP